MDHYVDVRLQPDAEFGPAMLMAALFTKLHKALVVGADQSVGASFPQVQAVEHMAAAKTSRTLKRLLMGTKVSRSSSSGVCSETARVQLMPSSISFSIPFTKPTVETVTERALIPKPSGLGSVMLRSVLTTAL